ncbi:serine/threonine protein kinase, partial [Streptomyces hirsutus]
MITRPTVATAAAVALTVTGITYASVSAYEPAQAAPGVQQAAAPVPASAPTGGDSGKDNGGKDSEGGDFGEGNGGRDNGGGDSGEGNGGRDNG